MAGGRRSNRIDITDEEIEKIEGSFAARTRPGAAYRGSQMMLAFIARIEVSSAGGQRVGGHHQTFRAAWRVSWLMPVAAIRGTDKGRAKRTIITPDAKPGWLSRSATRAKEHGYSAHEHVDPRGCGSHARARDRWRGTNV